MCKDDCVGPIELCTVVWCDSGSDQTLWWILTKLSKHVLEGKMSVPFDTDRNFKFVKSIIFKSRNLVKSCSILTFVFMYVYNNKPAAI